ncbi:MAG: short-chain fatty acyl-CoA regulator family protein [bacterium]
MSKEAARLGGRIRALRRREKLTQAAMAERLGISPSYLNLIENNRRPLTAALLIRLAGEFGVDVATFAEESDQRLASELLEALADPLFDEHGLTGQDVRDLVAQAPGMGRAVLTLYEAFRESRESAHALAARLSEGLAGVEPVHLPSEEVSALIQSKRNHFPDLEDAAEALRRRLGSGSLEPALRGLLAQSLQVVEAPVERMGGALRRLERERGRLLLSEALSAHSRLFQLAHVAGLLHAEGALDGLVADADLTSDTARTLARVALANYFAGAVLMPYAPFLAAAEATRYDIGLLGHKFQASFEQVCHRLSTLQRPGASGVPFHFMRVDIAGNISKRFSASGIQVARFSGACARWNVHAAFMTPGRIRVQLSDMPDGQRYFCVARTVQRSGAGWHDSHTLHAVGLGCRVEHGRRLVYADDVNLEGAAVPVGVTCRLCPRLDCASRAMPPIQQALGVDEDVRGLSFYAPVID